LRFGGAEPYYNIILNKLKLGREIFRGLLQFFGRVYPLAPPTLFAPMAANKILQCYF